MNPRILIPISMALNLALAAGIVLLIQSRPAPPVTPAIQPAALPSTPVATETPTGSAPSPGAGCQWSRLVSEDLKVYRDNLRAVGCPVPTIRDILMAEINERFHERRQRLLAEFQNRFWDQAVRGEAAIRTEWGPPIEALSAERQQLIAEVLGSGSDVEDPGAEKTFTEAKEKSFTPQELEEARIRASRESLWAAGLSGFEPTEEEWRAVTRARVAFEEAQQKLAGPDVTPEQRSQRQEQLELTQAIKTALGAERFAQYEIANHNEFQEIYKVTQRYGLPDRVALEAYEVRQAAATQAQQVRDNPNLSAAARKAALAALQQEVQRTLAKTLGEKVLATYKEYGGDWLKDL